MQLAADPVDPDLRLLPDEALQIASVAADRVDVVPAAADLGRQRIGEPAGAVDVGGDPIRELLPALRERAVRRRRLRGRRGDGRVSARAAAPGREQCEQGGEETREERRFHQRHGSPARAGLRAPDAIRRPAGCARPGRRCLRAARARRRSRPARVRAPRRRVDDVDVRDRELARGHVGEQLQHRLERVLVVVVRMRREQEDLRVVLLERRLELVLVADVDDRLELARGRPSGRAGSRPRPRRRRRAGRPEQRQRRRLPDAVDRAGRPPPPSHPAPRPPARRRVVDADDDRDPVTFRDLAGSDVVRLPPAAAEPSRSPGCACRSARRRPGARPRRAPSRRRRRAARARRERAGPSPRHG